MQRRWPILMYFFFVTAATAVNRPFDESIDAGTQVAKALVIAGESKRQVLLIFGANWCTQCRQVDQMLRANSNALGDDSFVTVKVNIGNFDRNMDLAKRYRIQLSQDLPIAAVITADNRMVHTGPLAQLTAPHHRFTKIILAITGALSVALVATSAVVFWRRRMLPYA